jgi:hypothetical protein
MNKVLIFQKTLAVETAIAEYLDCHGSNRKLGAAKGKITKLASELASEIGAVAARERILKFLKQLEVHSDRLDLLKKRFTPGSFYEEGNRLFGWWDLEKQSQAEALPLYTEMQWGGHKSYIISGSSPEWKDRGFDVASRLPVEFFRAGLEVKFDVKQSAFWLEYGYALPCTLQWHRTVWEDNKPALLVHRSIISAGFCQAWKWWDGAKWWYLEKRPELFADLDWWGEVVPQRFEPEGDPYAAVLGGLIEDQ